MQRLPLLAQVLVAAMRERSHKEARGFGMSEYIAGPIDSFRTVVRNHYYSCTSKILERGDRAAQFCYTSSIAGLMRFDRMSGGDVLVERSWSQVRSCPSEIYLIRFPKGGDLYISQDTARNCRVSTDEFVITYGNRPFQAKALAPAGESYTHVDIVVPSHLLRSLLPTVDQICGHSFKLDGGASVACSIADELICQSHKMEPSLVGRLARIGLDAIIADVNLQERDGAAGVAPTPSDFDRIAHFIEMNFTIAGLDGETVARACKMSRRHLNNVMAARGTTFADYLWERRLAQSHEWLASPSFNRFSITQIAHMSGFQCSSHFSKLYRQRFGTNPRSTRNMSVA